MFGNAQVSTCIGNFITPKLLKSSTYLNSPHFEIRIEIAQCAENNCQTQKDFGSVPLYFFVQKT